MAAGYVSLDVKDGDGVIRTVKFWSSDGTLTGVLQAAGYLGDPLPAGTNVIGHVINDASSAVIGHVISDTGSTTAVTQATAASLNATVVGTGTFAVQNTAATPAGSNVIGHVIADTGSTTAVTGNVTVVQPTGTNLHAVLDATSTTAVTQATAANLNATIVGTGTLAVQNTAATPAGTNTIGGVFQVPQAAGSGPALISYASITNTVTAAGTSAAHNLLGWSVGNLANAAVSYVQVFNLATGSVTLGTTPPTFVIAIPANGGSNLSLQFPVGFSTAISYAVTTTATGNTAPGAACNVTFFYI